MGFMDELKKIIHPYDDEDYDYEDDFEESARESRSPFEDRKEERRGEDRRTDKDVARRLIDFLSGVAYAGEGKIKKVAANTYIITPYSVDIMGDLIDELENNGLYL